MADESSTHVGLKATTSGAQAFIQTNAWLTAAAVAVYTTKALWMKLRELGLGKEKGDKDKNKDKGKDVGQKKIIIEEPMDLPVYGEKNHLRLLDLDVS